MGAETTDPTQGRRFFVANPNMMVTISEDGNSIEFSKGADVGKSVDGLQKSIRKIADEFLMNLDIKVFGKTIQPRDYAYQAKMNKGNAMMENQVRPYNHHLLGQILHMIKAGGPATATELAEKLVLDLSDIQPVLNKLVADGKLKADPVSMGDIQYSTVVDEAVMEDSAVLSPEVQKLLKSPEADRLRAQGLMQDEIVRELTRSKPQYKEKPRVPGDIGTKEWYDHQNKKDSERQRADLLRQTMSAANINGTDANQLGQIGQMSSIWNPKNDKEYYQGQPKDVQLIGNKRKQTKQTKGPVPAPSPKKWDTSDAEDVDFTEVPKDKDLKESFSKMFGSLKTSQQTLENVRILVRHKTPVDENVRGARSRGISAIFLECNGERMRFQHNHLAGARAMAQHMAHGGNMFDKVGSYISESVGQLLKLQSFNRYVTTNNLINEDSSGIIETIKENIQTLRTELKKLTGSKTYETVKARLETFEREALAEDDTSQLKELFTIRRFDEKFEEVLPIVKQLVQERDTFHKRIEEAAASTVILRREAMTTPIFEFASENARLGFRLSEFALRITENEELSSFVGKIGTKLCKEGMVNDFEKAVLRQVFENAKVEDKEEKEKKEIKESFDLEAYFNKFDYKFM
jgi:hypothetical protein